MPRRNAEVSGNRALTPAEQLYAVIYGNLYTGGDSLTVTFSGRMTVMSYRVRRTIRRKVSDLRKLVSDEDFLTFLERRTGPDD